MKGWVGLVGWPIADGLPTLVVTHQLQVERRTGKVRRPETDVLPLYHATNFSGCRLNIVECHLLSICCRADVILCAIVCGCRVVAVLVCAPTHEHEAIVRTALENGLFTVWFLMSHSIQPVKKTEWWSAGMVICLERGTDLHTAQLMPLPLTVFCFSKIHIGFTFLVPAHPGSPAQRAVKRVYVCMWHTA